jgi:hypothetical protein
MYLIILKKQQDARRHQGSFNSIIPIFLRILIKFRNQMLFHMPSETKIRKKERKTDRQTVRNSNKRLLFKPAQIGYR